MQALEADIRAWIETWNEDPRPYVWTKTADEILDSIAAFVNELQAQVASDPLVAGAYCSNPCGATAGSVYDQDRVSGH